ncbi:MAG: sensor histidine kinase [Bacillota bacterium]|nr:sensor histidine kinase [Bacillota bacterium]
MKKHLFCRALGAYARERLKLFLLLLIFAAVFALVFYLYRLRIDAVIYASALCLAIGLLAFAIDFFRFYRFHQKLQEAADSIHITLENLPQAKSVLAEDYQYLLQLLYENQRRIITETSAARSYLSDYYAMWVHQIKVPISAMHLLLDQEEANSPLKLELFKIEQYVEMALSYVRLESESSDYVLKEYDLDKIIKQAVRKYAPLFIAGKLSLDLGPMDDVKVLTDEKWLLFVLEQILSNAVKYTKKGSVSIYMQKPKTLVIEDTGIGIAPEDLGRLGEKGFTGYNGRIDKKSTGLGLYLCKEVLKGLSHKMSFESQVGKGTKVMLDLKTRDMLLE